LGTEIHEARPVTAFLTGAGIGTLGGLIGLGGAEFRLPLLIGLFGFGPLEAVILNKTMSLVVVGVALPARAGTVPLSAVTAHWDVIATLLLGSIVGAWWGAGWATRLQSKLLYRVIAVLLAAIACVLLLGHGSTEHHAALTGWALVGAGATVGLGIGIVAAVLGVAGGELLIPTIIILFGADLKLAGSLALAVSIPTMLAAFGRYSRDRSFQVVRVEWQFILIMAAGSIAGTYLGGVLLGVVATAVLLPLLAAILVVSAVKVWRHS
jgi:uncharacterized membrane protein YfcA